MTRGQCCYHYFMYSPKQSKILSNSKQISSEVFRYFQEIIISGWKFLSKVHDMNMNVKNQANNKLFTLIVVCLQFLSKININNCAELGEE